MNKMFTIKDVIKNWKKIEKQIKKADEALKRNDTDNAIYFTWLAVENLMNTLKMQINGRFTTSHRRKGFDAKRFYLKGVLKRDYSKMIGKLSRLRLVVAFHPYTKVKEEYTRRDAKQLLNGTQSLKTEVENILKKKGII